MTLARGARGEAPRPSVLAGLVHFVGEVEVVFGLWAVVLAVAITAYEGWEVAKHYLNDTVNYTEPLFVVVIMALASTRPIIGFAETRAAEGGQRGRRNARRLVDDDPDNRTTARLVHHGAGGDDHLRAAPVAPVLRPGSEHAVEVRDAGSVVRERLDRRHPDAFRGAADPDGRAALGLGHELRHQPFRLAGIHRHRPVERDVLTRCSIARCSSWRRSRRSPKSRCRTKRRQVAQALLPVPAWLVAVHVVFMVWTVLTAHYPALFLGGFLFFLGFCRATAAYQSRLELRTPLLVGFFLGGLVIHGGLQGWWIAPVLASLAEEPLFIGATLLTAFNDNALITYLATLVPNLSEPLKIAVVEGAVVGGGLTVIANAPNPAGQALLGRFFGGAVLPIGLAAGAILPTLIAAAVCRLF